MDNICDSDPVPLRPGDECHPRRPDQPIKRSPPRLELIRPSSYSAGFHLDGEPRAKCSILYMDGIRFESGLPVSVFEADCINVAVDGLIDFVNSVAVISK